MKIIIVSLTFLPKTGGLENVMAGLAQQWHQDGHDITVFTKISDGPTDYGYKVVRSFSLQDLLKAVDNADVFFEANISLKTFLVGLLHRHKWFVTHQVHYQHDKGLLGVIKNQLTRVSNNICPSKFISSKLKGKSGIIPNFYNNAIFKEVNDIKKSRDIVFVGRLVSDKGVTDLVSSLQILQQNGLNVSCSIVGHGPEMDSLKQQAFDCGLQNNISFRGILKGSELVEEINKHKVMVIPSRWDEPFGIVALEGLACGCRIVCSSGGGLPEAAGPHAFLFANGNITTLAESIKKALYKGNYTEEESLEITTYLRRHSAKAIADNYMQYFQKAGMKN